MVQFMVHCTWYTGCPILMVQHTWTQVRVRESLSKSEIELKGKSERSQLLYKLRVGSGVHSFTLSNHTGPPSVTDRIAKLPRLTYSLPNLTLRTSSQPILNRQIAINDVNHWSVTYTLSKRVMYWVTCYVAIASSSSFYTNVVNAVKIWWLDFFLIYSYNYSTNVRIN